MDMEWVFNGYYTLIAATVVLLLGKFLVAKVKFLQNFNIPEPLQAVWLLRLFCISCILATAVGVAPMPKPQWPAAKTAAS